MTIQTNNLDDLVRSMREKKEEMELARQVSEAQKRQQEYEEYKQRLLQLVKPIAGLLNLPQYPEAIENYQLIGRTQIMGIELTTIAYQADSPSGPLVLKLSLPFPINDDTCQTTGSVVCRIEELHRLPEKVGNRLIRLLDERADHLRWEERKKTEHSRRLVIAERIIHLARQWCQQEQEYTERLLEWALRETDRLWEPWTAYRIRYTPCAQMGNEPIIQSVVVLGDNLEDLLQRRIHTRIRPNGRLDLFAIGAILDIEAIPYHEKPHPSQNLPHHRHYPVDSDAIYTVNIPPFVTDEPEEPPKPTHKSWQETYDRQFGRELDGIIMYGPPPSSIAIMTPDELVKNYGGHL